MFTVHSPSANASSIRADGYSARVHASFFSFRVVASGTLTSGPVYPSGSISPFIATTYVTGAYTDLERDMRVTFHDPITGALKGETHIRRGGLINSGTFPIPEFSQAKLNLASGDLFTVWDEYRLHPRIVAATASFDPEQEFHTDEGSNPPPRILTGGAWAGWVDAGELFASVPFDYTESRNTDPDSTPTDVSFLTQTQTGVVVASGYADTDDQIVLEIDASSTAYTVTVEGTDTDNSKVTLRRTPVMVHDEAHPPHEVLITSYDGTQESGFNFTIEVVDGDVDLATIPEGCLCVLWVDERHSEAWASFRNRAPGREHIIGVGYIRRETLTGDENGVSTTTFEVESPLSVLRQLTSYSKVLEQSATPDAWSEVKTLSIQRAIIQLLQFYTNLLNVFDVSIDSGFLNKAYPALYLQRSNFADQVKELAEGVDARMVCDRTGRIDLHTFPPFIPLASRAAITTTWEFDADEVISWEISSIHYDPVEQMKTSGFSAGLTGNTALFSLYPGHAPGTGVDAPTRDRLIVDDQDDINERTSYYGTFYEDVYMNANGVKWRAFELRMTLRGAYNFFDFSKAYSEFTESLRGLTRIEDLMAFLFYLTAISWTPGEQGEGETQVTFRVATGSDAPSETYVPPDESLNYPPFEYPNPQPVPLPSLTNTGILGRGTANLALFDIGNNGYWLLRLLDGAVQFVDLTTTTTPMQGDLIMFIQDAFTPANGVIVTTTHAYRIIGFNDETVVDLDDEYAFRYTAPWRSLQSERGDKGFFLCASHAHGERVDIDRTLDSGANWTLSEQDLGDVYGIGQGVQPGCYVYAGASGKAVVSVYGTGDASILKQTLDEGNTFSSLGTSHFIIPVTDITAPLLNENILYHGSPQNGGGFVSYHLGRTTGGVYTDVSPTYGGEAYGPAGQFNVKVCDSDARKVLLCGQNRDSGTIKRGVFLSLDACATWRVLVTPDTSVAVSAGTITSDGTIFLFGTALLWVSYDGGTTFLDKSAGLVAGGAGVIRNIAGV